MARGIALLQGLGGRVLGGRRPPASLWAPALLVAAAVALPPIYLLVRGLGAGSEFWDLLLRARTLETLGRTVALVGGVAGLSVALGLPLAWLTTRADLPLRRAWSVLLALPLVIPSYVAAYVVLAAFGPKGLAQQLLGPLLGIDRFPDIHGYPGALLTTTMVTYPYVLLGLQAALRGMDPSLEDAAQSLGHSRWSTFRRVTLPLLRPAIAAGALLTALYALSEFGAVSLMRYETFTWAIYLQYQASFDRVGAAAFALVLVVAAGGVLLLELRVRGRQRYHRSAPGTARRMKPVRLGAWRWPALAFCGLVTTATLLMPLGVLSYWVAQARLAGEPLRVVWSAALSSGYAAGLGAAAAVAGALPVAILAVRYRSFLTVALERSTYVGFGLPGIVVALALVFFGANLLTPLYQTIALLVLAYVILFLPQAVGAARTSLLQVNPHIEEASRSLGESHLRTTVRVTAPLIRPGVLAGAALVFLSAMKELPATLLLSPIGIKTLATVTWSAADSGFLARAATPALLLVLVSSIPMALLSFRGMRSEP
ncbi:MAG: iron ABC transporter permease [Dehalococcoidia bacterium]|nr:iron ABC transporter permease [Dehalococcoidia bacterium]